MSQEREPAATQQSDDDLAGALARRRWQHLPDPIDPQQWTTVQPVWHAPVPEQADELARDLLLWGAAG